MMQGIVKFFIKEKGYGFITANNQDYFVHYKGIIGNGFKNLLEGQQVSFTPEKSERGLTANEVVLLSDLEDIGNH